MVSGQVLEHVPRVWTWLRELTRVVRSGGDVITVSPVSWPYHEAPSDCWRVYPDGMRALYEYAGLTVVLCEWGSLECPGRRHYLPGRSVEWQGLAWRTLQRLFWRIGLPTERAYDCVTVGMKSGDNAPQPAIDQ